MTIRYFLTCIFLCAIYITNAQATATLNEADRLLDEGRYFEASIAYERTLFSADDLQTRYLAISGKINCLKQQRLFAKAAGFIRANLSNNYPDSLRYQLTYQQMLCAYLAGSYENALSVTEQLKFSFPQQAGDPWIKVMQLFSLNELRRWNEAANVYRALLADIGGTGLDTALYAKIPRLKDADKARWLSTFIPGGGQLYAGKPLEALASIIMQAAGIYYGIISFQQHYYISAWFIGAGIFGSFHLGGVRRAAVLVNQYNDRKAGRFNQKVREAVLKSMGKKNPG